MYVVAIADGPGDPAEFVVATPVVAFDLALRAQRAGLRWHIVEEASNRQVPLEDIRHRALHLAAQDPGASEHLRHAERDHARGQRAGLN